MNSELEISGNRSMRKYSRKELFLRVCWGFVYVLLFRPSPRIAYGFRNQLLRMFGAKIGKQVHLFPNIKIMQPWRLKIGSYSSAGDGVVLYNLGDMKIGKYVTISQGAHLCGGTHDFRDRKMPLIKSSITVEDGVWICADAFIGPEKTLGEGCVIAARAVVVKDVKDREIIAGNPAKVIGQRKFKDEK